MSGRSSNINPSKKKKSDGSNRSKARDVRIAVRLSWSGRRVAVEGPVDASKTTVLRVLESIRSDLPAALPLTVPPADSSDSSDQQSSSGGEPTVLHMRSSVPRSRWGTTTLGQIGVENGGSALLTLNLPRTSATTAEEESAEATPMETDGVAAEGGAESEGMQIDDEDDDEAKREDDKKGTAELGSEKPSAPPSTLTCEGALDRLMSSNFDVESKECVLTLLKLINNVLSKPGDPKVRSINLANQTFRKKVGEKAGGVDFLLAVGFTRSSVGARIGGAAAEERLELLPGRESQSELLSARRLLNARAVELGVDPSDLPKVTIPPPPPPSTIIDKKPSSVSSSSSFDPYRGHKFNTAAASVGADPSGVAPDGEVYVSKIERQLNNLTARADRLEKDARSGTLDRKLCALRPGESPSGGESVSSSGGVGGGGGGDASLIAQRARRMEEERKKREEGGFTTKAMRDLERMKKAKVYSHTLLRISFPDGCSLSAQFYPSEKVRVVKDVVRSALVTPDAFDFDLYVAPPRRVLADDSTLASEQLVPAAKVHVSWKAGRQPPSTGKAYIKPELFGGGRAASSGAAFPDGKPVLAQSATKRSGVASTAKGSTGESSASKLSEEDMVARMMGKAPKGLKSNGSSAGKDGKGSDGGGKPKWFKR